MKYLLDPTNAQRWRWITSLHECSHGLALAKLCHRDSTVTVFNDGGGTCRYQLVGDALIYQESVALACGDAAGRYHYWFGIPAGRCRRIQAPTDHADCMSDERKITLYAIIAREDLKVEIDLGVVLGAADDFVFENLKEISALARVLFRRGTIHIAAEAAKGICDESC